MEWIVEAESLSDFIDHGRYTLSTKPLIRCKDCKHSKNNENGEPWICGHPDNNAWRITPDQYCGYAERRTDDANDIT